MNQPSKLSELKLDEQLKILLYGDSGNGKTCMAGTFPGKIHVMDFDGKINSLGNYLTRTKQFDKLKDISYDDFSKYSDKDRYPAYFTRLVELEKLAKEGKFPYQTVVLDSLTTYCGSLLREIYLQNPTIKGPAPDVPGMQHYLVNGTTFKDQMQRLLRLPCNIIVTAHIETEKDEITGEILRKPSVAGKLASWLPVVFQEVYRVFVEQKDGKTIYRAQTKPDARFSICRSQLGLPQFIDLDYKSLASAFSTTSESKA